MKTLALTGGGAGTSSGLRMRRCPHAGQRACLPDMSGLYFSRLPHAGQLVRFKGGSMYRDQNYDIEAVTPGQTSCKVGKVIEVLPMISRLVSGGQTGVDRAALDAALKLGV